VGLAVLIVAATLIYVCTVESEPPQHRTPPGLVPVEEVEETVGHEQEEPANAALEEAEREVIAGPARADYIVLDADGAPVAEAEFLLVESGRILLRGATDSLGQFSSADCADRSASLLVLAANSAPQVLEAPRAAGLHVLHMEHRWAVSGVVTVDGRRPGEPVPLTLDADRAGFNIGTALGLTWTAAGLESSLATELASTTSEGGTFSFRGLPVDWHGELKFSTQYQLKDRTLATDPWWTTMALEQPIEGLLVELVKPLRIVGRIVEVAGGNPVADARIYPALVYADGSRSRYALDDARADDEGRFELTLVSGQVRGRSITICPPNHLVERVIPIESGDLTTDLDLGDIPLRIGRGQLQLNVLVQDREGAPLEGARVSIPDASGRTGAPTDVEGRTVITGLAEGYTLIRALAVGYAIEEVQTFIGPEGGELVITMCADTLLRLRLLAPDGTMARSVGCAITTELYPFEQKNTARIMFSFREMGASLQQKINRGDGTTMMLYPTRKGINGRPIVVSGIMPGLPMRLQFFSRRDTFLGERQLAPLMPQEQRDVDIVLDLVPRSLHVRVVDEYRNPLAQSRVGISFRNKDLGSGKTGSHARSVTENGEFEFKEIFARQVDLSADCDGYVPFRDRQCVVPTDESTVEIRLTRGRDVLVTIEDEAGSPLRADVGAKLDNGAVVIASGIKKGQCMLKGLPDAPVIVTAVMGAASEVGAAQIRRRLGAHESELRIVLPAVGRVEGQVKLPLGINPGDRYIVWLNSDNGELGNRAAPIEATAGVPIDFSFKKVLSGKYQARVQWRDMSRGAENHSEWMSEGVGIEVKPDDVTTVDL
jgi:hypothetical protein